MTDTKPFEVEARGMRCPWPALRAAKAMRDHDNVLIRADDPIAPRELAALAEERGWVFDQQGDTSFILVQSAEKPPHQ